MKNMTEFKAHIFRGNGNVKEIKRKKIFIFNLLSDHTTVSTAWNMHKQNCRIIMETYVQKIAKRKKKQKNKINETKEIIK